MNKSQKALLSGNSLSLVWVLAAFALGGCASHSPMRLAMTEIGTTSESEYGAYALRLQRAVSVTGLGAEEVVGTLTTDIDKWSLAEQLARFNPIAKDLPDALGPRLITGQSRVVERRFEAEPKLTLENLTTLRDELLNVQARIAQSVLDEIDLEVLTAAKQAQRTSDHKLTEQTQTLDAVKRLLQSNELNDAKTIDTAFDKAIQQVRDKINANGLTASLNQIRSILAKGGIIISNWQRDVAAGANATASSAEVGGSGKKSIGGFVILASPRIFTLYIGDDALARAKDSSHIDSAFKSQRNYITHYQVRAKQVLFAETQQSALQLNVQANLTELAKLAATGGGNLALSSKSIETLQARVAATYAAVTAATSTGVLDATHGCVVVREFSLDKTSGSQDLDKEIEVASDSIAVINMRVALDDYLHGHSTEAPKKDEQKAKSGSDLKTAERFNTCSKGKQQTR